MKTIKASLKGIKKGIIVSASYGASFFNDPDTNPIKLISRALDYLLEPKNPIQRALRCGKLVIIAPIAYPFVVLIHTTVPTVGILAGTMCIAASPVVLIAAGLIDALKLGYKGMKLGYKNINDLISLFDEPNAYSQPKTEKSATTGSSVIILKELKISGQEITNICHIESEMKSHEKINNQPLTNEIEIPFYDTSITNGTPYQKAI